MMVEQFINRGGHHACEVCLHVQSHPQFPGLRIRLWNLSHSNLGMRSAFEDFLNCIILFNLLPRFMSWSTFPLRQLEQLMNYPVLAFKRALMAASSKWGKQDLLASPKEFPAYPQRINLSLGKFRKWISGLNGISLAKLLFTVTFRVSNEIYDYAPYL